MGRQIGFYASQKDMSEMIDYLYANGGIMINENGTELSKDELDNIQDREYIKKKYRFPDMFVKCKDSNIIFNYYPKIDRKSLDMFKSEVIDFSPSKRSDDDTYYAQGRFHIETATYNNCPNIQNLYNIIVKYIKKNFIISNTKDCYMGKDAFELYKQGKYTTWIYTFAEKKK